MNRYGGIPKQREKLKKDLDISELFYIRLQSVGFRWLGSGSSTSSESESTVT